MFGRTELPEDAREVQGKFLQGQQTYINKQLCVCIHIYIYIYIMYT